MTAFKGFIFTAVLLMGISTFAQVTTPALNQPITPNRIKAAIIYQRLAGVKIPIDSQELIDMEALLDQGKDTEAADIALQTKGFYNITLKHFAAKMSTRDQTTKAPLSDFVATIIGIAKDDISAKEMLSADYIYAARPGTAGVGTSDRSDFVVSNNHYADIENLNLDLGEILVQKRQIVQNSSRIVVNNPDPAGVITSRAFTKAHAVAGTNRRLVHFTFLQFLCIDMEQWADTSSPDNRVGPDIDRAPGGDPMKYQTTCKGCHGNMDNLRGAFANIDFANNYLKHGLVLTNRERTNGQNSNREFNGTNGIAWKYRRNNDVFPGGYNTTDNSWINNAIAGTNKSYFGWRGPMTGFGIKSYGQMLSNSEAFSRCMVKRVYRSVCKREISQFETDMLRNIASDFETNGYKFKYLFKRIATSESCIGKN